MNLNRFMRKVHCFRWESVTLFLLDRQRLRVVDYSTYVVYTRGYRRCNRLSPRWPRVYVAYNYCFTCNNPHCTSAIHQRQCSGCTHAQWRTTYLFNIHISEIGQLLSFARKIGTRTDRLSKKPVQAGSVFRNALHL
jgi:hypothetical protein